MGSYPWQFPTNNSGHFGFIWNHPV
ncbi:hypothetical protein CIB84_011416 [Bambusicola thoracicus]|uniref:Uncharacterized protein n=1 Tax=Bambusicola thoracicus TaxID=9083 RepID=A0A2P4SL53_BAMTH|nr:hypothetical protein CIB84_011416 [Bambusicola thoracicus]